MTPRTTVPANLGRMNNDVNRIFDNLTNFGGSLMSEKKRFPALNVIENETTLYVEAEVPGVTLEEIEVTLIGTDLTIKGVRTINIPENAQVVCQECGSLTFERTIELPFDVVADKVEAKITNGVLVIVLPKSENSRTQTIKVKGA